MERFGNRRSSGFRRNNFRDNFGPREPREMHKATCSSCGKECEVPFKPTPGKDVFCRECYMNKKSENN